MSQLIKNISDDYVYIFDARGYYLPTRYVICKVTSNDQIIPIVGSVRELYYVATGNNDIDLFQRTNRLQYLASYIAKIHTRTLITELKCNGKIFHCVEEEPRFLKNRYGHGNDLSYSDFEMTDGCIDFCKGVHLYRMDDELPGEVYKKSERDIILL